ncbi:unnamed protein product [Cyprideis torosa]|uniref:Uncharacterized protein n=1 Tax=Cyprideis torosa TaxID=163714 RepID=A0A7R8WR35_9CRUS|nr:unnamed protein product [Cyprideis torosa]CAG0903707.1 unnamed protein product [Cyprideis torosa]
MEPDDPEELPDSRLRLRGLTRLSPEGVGQTQKILQAKEDHRDSSLESLSSANHSHGSSLAPPTASII